MADEGHPDIQRYAGILAHRQALAEVLEGSEDRPILHDELRQQLDATADAILGLESAGPVRDHLEGLYQTHARLRHEIDLLQQGVHLGIGDITVLEGAQGRLANLESDPLYKRAGLIFTSGDPESGTVSIDSDDSVGDQASQGREPTASADSPERMIPYENTLIFLRDGTVVLTGEEMSKEHPYSRVLRILAEAGTVGIGQHSVQLKMKRPTDERPDKSNAALGDVVNLLKGAPTYIELSDGSAETYRLIGDVEYRHGTMQLVRNGDVRTLYIKGENVSVEPDVWTLLHYLLEHRGAMNSREIADSVFRRAGMSTERVATIRNGVVSILKRAGGFKLESNGQSVSTEYFIRPDTHTRLPGRP